MSSTPLDSVLALTLPAGRGVLRSIARDIRRMVARAGTSPTDAVYNDVRRVVVRSAPRLASAISDGLVAAWVWAASDVASGVDVVTRIGSPVQSTRPTRYAPIETAAKWLQMSAIMPFGLVESVRQEQQRDGAQLAGEMIEDITENMRAAMVKALTEGSDVRGFVATNAEATGIPDNQLEAIYRTNLGLAYSAGQRETLTVPAVAAEFPYVRYVAVHDSRVEDTHLAMERHGLDGGPIYRADDPVILKFWPPWRWSCRCHVIPYSIEDAAEAGVREARRWLRSGQAPRRPEFVAHPPFDLPRGWRGLQSQAGE